jgi:hypothetical protein
MRKKSTKEREQIKNKSKRKRNKWKEHVTNKIRNNSMGKEEGRKEE